MNITEQQVREVLEKHSDLGFEIIDSAPDIEFESQGYIRTFRIRNDQLWFSFYLRGSSFYNFNVIRGKCDIECDYSDFMSGKCDFSKISGCCDSEVWNRIQHMLRDLITLITQPEQSLEDKVRELTSWFSPIDLTVSNTEVHFKTAIAQYKVTDTLVGERSNADGASWSYFSISTYQRHGVGERIWKTLVAISALLTPEYTPLTIESLQQRVSELEEELEGMHSAAITGQGRINYLDEQIEKLQNQLDNATSNADHECEMQKWESAFEEVTKQRDEARKEAEKFKQAFFREYFRSQPVLDLSGEDSYP